MNTKRSHLEEETDEISRASCPKRPRTFDIASHGGVLPGQGACSHFTHEDYTIAWLCALPLELAASRAMLDEEHSGLPIHTGDDNVYVLGHVGQHNVVMACLPGRYGTNNAAIVATNLKRSFPNIRATLMVGIGGGSPNQADLYLGDVVVGTRVMQYDMGKVSLGGRFEETAIPKIPASLLNSAVSALRSRHQSNSRISSLLQSRLPHLSRPPKSRDRLFKASYGHPPGAPTCDGCDQEELQPRALRLSEEPKVHYGAIASGNKVMKDARTRDEIARRFSALCFEMEAAGMMDNHQCLPIRGICDYSDSHKQKEWQDYAAATAAAYARELLGVLPSSSRELGRAPTISFGGPVKSDTAASERRQLLVESLSFPQIDARKTTIRAAHARTCRWFLRHAAYKDWLNPELQLQNHGFLWMRGKAGAGKSTLMKFLYLESKRKNGPNTTTASFFFNARGDDLEKSIVGMYRSLLMQLLKRFPDLQSILDDTDIIPWSQRGCPDLDALKELLRAALMALGRRSFTCFIDALDECDEQEVRDMVQYFEDLAEHTTENGIQLRICFSSRPYPYITIRKGISLTLENESGHAEDLAQYVKSNLRIDDPSLLEDLQSQILSKASGIFLWIVLTVDILNKEDDEGGLALRTKLSQIPERLSELFKSILTRDQKSPQRLLLCVLWILCAKRPLTPAEFRHVLWVGLLDQRSGQKGSQVDTELPSVQNMDSCVKLVTSASKGLAEITKSKQPTVQFVHESVRDFLVKERGLQDLWPELGFQWEGLSHQRLKLCCARYLALSEILTADNVEAEDQDSVDAWAYKYPFLEYASQQVLHHADAAALVMPQDEFLSQFFASAGVRVLNFFERRKIRRYGISASPLYILADRGLGNLIRLRMKHESHDYAPGETYDYPIFAALANGHKDAVAALLGLSSVIYDGEDITKGLKYRKDVGGFKGRTPLSWAAQEGRLGLVKVLIQGGADVNERDRRGSTPLIRASEHGHVATVKVFLDPFSPKSEGHGCTAPQSPIGIGADVNARDADGVTALMKASVQGHEAVVRLLINHGADINVQTGNRKTALIMASERGHEGVVQLLLDGQADVNAQYHRGMTALMRALLQGHLAVARLIVSADSLDVRAQDGDGWTALRYASICEDEALVQLLLDKGADIDTRAGNGETPLMAASRRGLEGVARRLIDAGTDVNARGPQEMTALLFACRGGHEAVARLLLDRGADITARNLKDETVLMEAAAHGRKRVVQLLLDIGADVNAQEKTNGETALLMSARSGHEAVVQVLLNGGAHFNHQNMYGETALTLAAKNRKDGVVKLLVDGGADVEIRDQGERTALDWAVSVECPGILQL